MLEYGSRGNTMGPSALRQYQRMISRRIVSKPSIILLMTLCKVLTLCLPTVQRACFAKEGDERCRSI